MQQEEQGKAFLSPQPRSKNEWNHDGWIGEERRCCQWQKKPSSLSPGAGVRRGKDKRKNSAKKKREGTFRVRWAATLQTRLLAAAEAEAKKNNTR